jgi:hypothetical protein
MVGGRRIKEAPLPPEAEFTVGPLTFRAEYQYDGDLSKLPSPVWAEEEATAPSAAAEPAANDKPAKASADLVKPKSSEVTPESPSGAFDDFLEELG